MKFILIPVFFCAPLHPTSNFCHESAIEALTTVCLDPCSALPPASFLLFSCSLVAC